MRLQSFLRAGCALPLALLLSVPASGSSLHTFASSNEGWQIVSYPFRTHVPAPVMSALPFDASNGLPPGSVRVGDIYSETGIAAPADHLGNQASIYGGSISYDILIRFSDNVTYPAVVLNGGTKSIYYDAPSPPIGVWQSRTVPLTETGWRMSGTSVPATLTDFMDVLSNLAGIYIYTEWNTGADDTNVDNIALPIGGPTGVGGSTPSARGLIMQPAFPNPSGASSAIAFTLGEPGRVTVSVFDVRGQRIKTLAAGRFVSGLATFAWDGHTDAGEAAPSGIYFARVMTASGEVATQKIVRVR